jgi:hypothetical protein
VRGENFWGTRPSTAGGFELVIGRQEESDEKFQILKSYKKE